MTDRRFNSDPIVSVDGSAESVMKLVIRARHAIRNLRLRLPSFSCLGAGGQENKWGPLFGGPHEDALR